MMLRPRRFAPITLGLLLAIAVAGCGSSASEEPRTGNPAVYDRINAETDCATLQGEFDIAERNHHTDYMQAADDRMRQLGCYR
jgi:hypothetical protein